MLKLCDFGTARKLEHTLTNAVGTSWYMAPEVIRGGLIFSPLFSAPFVISPLSIFLLSLTFTFTHTHTHNKYGGGCGYIIQGYHGCDSVRCASLVVVTSTAYTLITLPILSALTLNQPRTHKCVQSLHESLRILWGYNTRR